jgi:hypothetical protein
MVMADIFFSFSVLADEQRRSASLRRPEMDKPEHESPARVMSGCTP